MNLTLTDVLLIIITIAISIIAIKITVSFNINEYLKNRKEGLRDKAKNYCPHAIFTVTHDGQNAIQSTFVSPPGTTNYICSKCQLVTYRPPFGEEARIRNFIENPNELIKQEKKFAKLVKKAGLL